VAVDEAGDGVWLVARSEQVVDMEAADFHIEAAAGGFADRPLDVGGLVGAGVVQLNGV
jgi:hypothetical protein